MCCLGLVVAPQLELEGGLQGGVPGCVNPVLAAGTRRLQAAGRSGNRSRAGVSAERAHRGGGDANRQAENRTKPRTSWETPRSSTKETK